MESGPNEIYVMAVGPMHAELQAALGLSGISKTRV
jgi:hypothetical protein